MLTNAQARRIASLGVAQAGGGWNIVSSPRHPFSMNSIQEEQVEDHTVRIHFGEMSSPAIVEVEGWVFEIKDDDELVLLDRPRSRKLW